MRRHAFRFFMTLVVLVAILPTRTAATVADAAPEIAWESCPIPELPARECGELIVPLDYDEPDGATIALALVRMPATDPDRRIGSLITNPGGPGGSGVDGLVLTYPALEPLVHERFDYIAFDPRGVGQSAPVRCFDSIAERTAFFAALPSVPIGADQEIARQRSAEELARRCGERNAEVLPHLSTANVARDMDLLRHAVGDEQLTYLASSYGTYLGATYANLFPNRIRAMVLDGVIDPPSYTRFDHGVGAISGPDTSSFLRILSNEGSAQALQEFFVECAAAGPDRCAFAEETATATSAKFDTLMDRLRDEPMIVQGPAGSLTVTYSLVIETVRGALYAAPFWAGLAEGLQRLHVGDAAGFLVATHNLGGPAPTDYLNGQEATPAINCVDADNPDDPARFQEMVSQAEARTPFMGAVWAYLSQPCLFWPAADADRYQGPWDAETSATILLISRVYDPATPHASAIAASESLAKAQLLTIDGWGHSYFEGGRSRCADAAMASYLVDLVLPKPGTVCAEDAPPFSAELERAVPPIAAMPMAEAPVAP